MTNIDIVTRLHDELNKGNHAIIDELLAEDFQDHSSHGEFKGIEAYKQYAMGTVAAFPDIHFTIFDTIAEGNKVVIRAQLTGTNSGPFMEMPPTNKKVDVAFIAIYRIEHGLIAERWLNGDDLGFSKQLGLIPDQPQH